MRHTITSIAIALCVLTLSGALSADQKTTLTARRLFTRGRQLMFSQQVDAACEMFKASLALAPKNGTRLHLARCHQLQGKTATAYREYGLVAVAAHKRKNWPRKEEALRRREDLRPNLSRLIVQLSSQRTDIEVMVDHKPLPIADYGVPLPINPGEHHIVATGPGYAGFSRRVLIGATRDRQRVIIPTPALVAPVRPPDDKNYAAPVVFFSTSSAAGIASAALLGIYMEDAASDNGNSTAARIKVGFAGGLAVVSVVSLGLGIEILPRRDANGTTAAARRPTVSLAASPEGAAMGASIPF